MIKFFKKNIIYCIYFPFFIVFILQLRILKTLRPNVKLIYSHNYGFGDYLFFCSRLILKLNKKKKIYCFSKTQYEIARFYFDEHLIIKQFIMLPKILNDSHFGYVFLRSYSHYMPTKINSEYSKKEDLSWHYMGNREIINYLKKKLLRIKFSSKIYSFTKKKYICLFVKNFSLNKNNHIFHQVRQTRNLNKIYNLIDFLNKKKVNTLILGTNRDHFIKLIPNKIKKLENIYFFKDLSKNYTVEDQALVAYKSKGFIGSNSGANGFFGLFLKKHLIFDDAKYPTHRKWQNFHFIYKKIYNNKTKKIEILDRKKVLKKNKYLKTNKITDYKIIENTFSEIKNKTIRLFKI